MSEISEALELLRQEASAARAHFHTWWALRSLALPDFYSTMNNHEFVDFFHVSNAGNYELVFIHLAKFFDPDNRTCSYRHLKSLLKDSGQNNLLQEIETLVQPHTELVEKICRIRNTTISHNQQDLPRAKAYELNGITPNEIREVIDAACDVVNTVAELLNEPTRISDGQRNERATLNMLAQLKNGET